MRNLCIVCEEPLLRKQGEMCQNCVTAKIVIQRSALAMMQLHGIVNASGMCVDCGVRPATCRDHRHYASPLKVEFVCGPCNIRRGTALDLHELIKAHRGLISAPIEKEDAIPLVTPPSTVFNLGFDLKEYMQGIERIMISDALQKTRHNKTAAAKILGISFRALRYRIEQLNIGD